MHTIWRRLTTTRYARTLEAELALERAHSAEQGIEISRLRAENRALLNSILGIAGVPPLPATEADLAAVQSSSHAATISSVGARHAVPERDAWQAATPSLQNEIACDSFRTAGTLSDAPDGARPAPLPLGLPETEMLEQQQNLNSKTPAASGQDARTTARRYENPGTGATQPIAARTANHSRSRANQTPHAAAPTRRRSWPQIHRRLEFDSAQKEKPDADPLQ